jgi:hypothetical protein
MEYLLMICSEESKDPTPGSEEFNTMMDGFASFSAEMEAKGVIRGGNALQPVATATTVRLRKGKAEIIDGPFVETKEVLGGYYLLDCKDLDEAIAYAKKIPVVGWGSVEIRPIMKY